jgi:SAM-dependent methyltransferase
LTSQPDRGAGRISPLLLRMLRCPACAAAIEQAPDGNSLQCLSCGTAFPVVGSIPRFVPPENYAANFGFQWNRFRGTQLDSHSGAPVSRARFVRETGWSPDDLQGKLVLDAGCGAGRFAEIASETATVVAVDYSSAVEACRANLPRDNVHVVQADIYALPFESGTFDAVYSLGVVQHTPDVERAVKALVAPLKPGGELVVDVYVRSWKGWLHPRTWLRPITTRMDSRRLFQMIERAAPALMTVSNGVGSIPVVGRLLRRFVPVANYTGILPLSDAQLHEWAVLDTFDWLAPKFDQPQTAEILEQWLTEAGLTDVKVFKADHLTARGRKPADMQADARRH